MPSTRTLISTLLFASTVLAQSQARGAFSGVRVRAAPGDELTSAAGSITLPKPSCYLRASQDVIYIGIVLGNQSCGVQGGVRIKCMGDGTKFEYTGFSQLWSPTRDYLNENLNMPEGFTMNFDPDPDVVPDSVRVLVSVAGDNNATTPTTRGHITVQLEGAKPGWIFQVSSDDLGTREPLDGCLASAAWGLSARVRDNEVLETPVIPSPILMKNCLANTPDIRRVRPGDSLGNRKSTEAMMYHGKKAFKLSLQPANQGNEVTRGMITFNQINRY